MFKHFIGILLVLAATNAQTNTTKDKFIKFIYDRCRKNSLNAQDFDNFNNHFYDLSSFADAAFGLLPDGVDEYCNSERFRLLQGLNIVLLDLKNCLPKTEQYLPPFLYTSFEAFTNFTCIDNGKNVKSFFSSTGTECRRTLEQANALSSIQNCFKRFFAPLKTDVTKQELCDDISMAKKCFKQVLDDYCGDFLAFKKLNHDLFKSLSTPCNSSKGTFNSPTYLLVLFLIFISKWSINYLC